jgi:regulatory Fis family protein
MSEKDTNITNYNDKKYNDTQIEVALREVSGNINAAANSLGCTRRTVYNYIKDSEYLKELVVELREGFLDDCENMVMQHIFGLPVYNTPNDPNSGIQRYLVAPNDKMLMWFLDRHGKNRGYGKEQLWIC